MSCFQLCGNPGLGLLESRAIDLTALEPHAATCRSDPASRRAHTGVNDKASHRNKGFEKVHCLVDSLLPLVMALVDAASLEHIPDSLGEPVRPFAEDQERFPRINHPLVVDSALALGVDNRQAPDVA